MKKKALTIAAAALTAVIALAGCAPAGPAATASQSPADMPGMPGMNGSSMPGTGPAAGAGATAAGPHNDSDVMFARMMIPHHRQAIEMSTTLLAKQGINSAVTDLASQIKEEQGPEIPTLTGWLTGWNATATAAAGQAMDPVMGAGDMQALAAAQGTAAARVFLEQMIIHHGSAVQMAEDEISKGSNPAAVALAKNIAASQQSQIDEMKKLLGAL